MTCLLYHGVFRADPYAGLPGLGAVTARTFEAHLRWLLRAFEVVPARALARPPRRPGRPRVALTFDDGFANFADCAYPILARHRVPATLFVATGFLDGGPPLWFSRVEAACLFGPATPLELGGCAYPRATAADRVRTLAEVYQATAALPWAETRAWAAALPEPAALLDPATARDRVAALTTDELRALARDPLLDFGSHTVTHPYLTRCSAAETAEELARSRAALEEIVQRPVDLFAYPLGDYDAAVRAEVRRVYAQAWAVDARTPDPQPGYEHERFGVYGASIPRLLFKAAGLARLVRLAGRPIG